MAGDKSREGRRSVEKPSITKLPEEGKLTTLECMECNYREVFTERQFKYADGLSCDVCGGPVMPAITKSGERIRNRRMNKQGKKANVGELKLDIDCEGAVKGLKAVQREAKKATASLRELEETHARMNRENLLTIDSGEADSVINAAELESVVGKELKRMSKLKR